MSALHEAISMLTDCRTVGVSSHINPDGDGVGSLLALSMVLRELGKEVYASLPEPDGFPPQYRFLPGADFLVAPAAVHNDLDVFVALDCSNVDRLGILRGVAEKARVTINIDHHEDNQHYASLNIVGEKASSTAEIVYAAIKTAGWEINPDVATCLYTGVLTDTGRFQHRNTGPSTFALASELVEAGADIFRVVKEVYESRSLSYTHLLGITLQRLQVRQDAGLMFSYITRADLEETGAALPETEDLIDYLRGVRGNEVVALFKELQDGRVRVSLRSQDGLEVGPVARNLGGGGHAMAAGYTSDLDIQESIEALAGVLRDAR